MKRLNVAFALVAMVLVVALAASTAEASCNPNKTISNQSRPDYCAGSYIQFNDNSFCAGSVAGGTGCPQINSAFWETNNPAAGNSGTFDGGQNWVSGNFGAGYWWFRAFAGTAGVNGCPSNCVTVYIENEDTEEFILWSAPEAVGPSCGLDNNFDFTGIGGGGAQPSGQSVRPRVTASARNGGNPDLVDLTYDIPSPAGGTVSDACGGAVTGTFLYSQSAASRPSSNPNDGWSQVASFGAGGTAGAQISVDCSNQANDVWIATGLGVSGQQPQVLSAPTIVECNPAIADPPKLKGKPRPGTEGPPQRGNR